MVYLSEFMACESYIHKKERGTWQVGDGSNVFDLCWTWVGFLYVLQLCFLELLSIYARLYKEKYPGNWYFKHAFSHKTYAPLTGSDV
jgi:hypothetical protein